MSQFACTCGHVLSLTISPNEHQARLISDVEFERVAEDFTGACEDTNVIFERLVDAASRVVKCPECSRLYIESGMRGPNVQYQVFKLEFER